MNRRQLLTGVASTAIAAMVPAIVAEAAASVQAMDTPNRAKKFDGPGFYMLSDPLNPPRKFAFWCEEDGQFIRMSKFQGGETEVWVGARAFDRHDVWKFYSIEEIDRKNGLGKYAKAAR